jgi:sulfate permease, SulP family
MNVPWSRWKPRLLDTIPQYSTSDLVPDLVAGVTVGLVALPLAMAFGIASGTTPQAGIYTAIIGGLLVSVFGGSRIQIGGPTGAFVVVVAAIITEHGISGLYMITMMAGVILLIMAFTGLGTAVKFIPRPIVIGFTNGIAVLIASTQIKDFFGLTMSEVPGEFIPRVRAYGAAMETIDPVTVALAVTSLAVIILTPRLLTRVPGQIVALLGATAAVALFTLPVDTVGSRFGGIPSGLPDVHMPIFRADLILPLLPAALTVAILAAVESLLSAVVGDNLSGDRHNSHAELVGQGLANVAVPLVGGIPVTGAIARTATNFKAGARTPVAGIVHSMTLLAVLLVAAPLASYVPMATLAAVLFVVAYNMGEWGEIPDILRLDYTEILVWLITFGLTVVADLTLAVEVGMALAALLYIHKVSQTTTVSTVTGEYIERGRAHILQDKPVPDYVSIVRIQGPFLFGTTENLSEETADVSKFAPVVVLRLRNMTAIDATGLHALEQLADRLKKSGRTLLLCGALPQPSQMLHRVEFVEHVGEDNILPHINAALERAAVVFSSSSRSASASAPSGHAAGSRPDRTPPTPVIR